MKRAGEYLAAIIDANLYSKAKVYSGFFSSWGQITQGCGIAAAAGHSRVRELEQGILVVEADHPGWVQILQTKAPQIISAARRRFPELDIRGISFTLSRPRGGVPEKAESPKKEIPPEREAARKDTDGRPGEDRIENWEQIGDSELKDSLKRLEQSIENRDKSAGRRTRGKK
ncbi:MAG: DUF721 domain-containing protein [Treponema sp.]|jgi:hypothetical protein|nr:DUF721 domain-containing protein [Treponema sp.]